MSILLAAHGARTIPAIISIAMLAAPATAGRRDPTADPDYQVTLPGSDVPQQVPNGSIFQVSSGYSALTNGGRAATVGDILTILLVERTQATKTNSAQTGRDGSIGLTPPSTGFLSLFAPSDVAAGGGQSFQGSGQAAQSNQLSGEITVTVAQVFSNGTLRVRGQKQLTLNRGDEYVQISGLVRQADISPDNRVLSTRVADARITYSGRGEIARASRQGWLQRFFSIISPF